MLQVIFSFIIYTLIPSIMITSEETEKYAHVTFFFNGGIEKQFSGEERYMVPSPKVATYDKDPKMNAHGVADKVAEILERGEDQFVMCNFAPPDMVKTMSYDKIRYSLTRDFSGWTHRHLRRSCRSDYRNRQSCGYDL